MGEPINSEAWHWFYNLVGHGKCSIVDTFWQTETGGHVITPLPGATPMKPGSAVGLSFLTQCLILTFLSLLHPFLLLLFLSHIIISLGFTLAIYVIPDFSLLWGFTRIIRRRWPDNKRSRRRLSCISKTLARNDEDTLWESRALRKYLL